MKKCSLILLLLGIAWRLARYASKQPIWGDEAMLDLNLMNRDFWAILKPLDYAQVAPPLFLMAEWWMQHLFGGGEYALRLLPLLAGISAAILFWFWSWRILPGFGALIAAGFFSIGYYPVRYSVDLKPYAFDQLAAVALLCLATAWMRRPTKISLALWLMIAIILAIPASYPAVFIAGAICIAMLWIAAREKRPPAWAALAACSLLTAAMFALVLFLVSGPQYQKTAAFMQAYWQEGLPSTNLAHDLRWLFEAHLGDSFAYPIGAKHGGSAATFLLFALGILWFWRVRQRRILAMLGLAFLLTLLAAIMQRYPYGGGPRVSQHLAPIICLLCGAGAELALSRLKEPAHARCAFAASAAALFALAIAGLTRDLISPYKTPADAQARDAILAVERDAQSTANRLFVLNPMPEVPVNFQCYLRWWNGQIIWATQNSPSTNPSLAVTPASPTRAIVLNFAKQSDARNFPPSGPNWQFEKQRELKVQIGPKESGPAYFQAVYWLAAPPAPVAPTAPASNR